MVINSKKPQKQMLAIPRSRTRRRPISEEVLKVRGGPNLFWDKGHIRKMALSPVQRDRSLAIREMSRIVRGDGYPSNTTLPEEALKVCLEELSKMLESGIGINEAMAVSEICTILKSVPDGGGQASAVLDDAIALSVGSLRQMLRDDEPALRSDAILTLYALAREDPEAVMPAIPELKEAYRKRGIGIKLFALETLAALVEGMGYPFGIIDKEFFKQLKVDVMAAQEKCRAPSAIDRKDYLESFVEALKRVIGAESALTPEE
jgi:hypothetical protein